MVLGLGSMFNHSVAMQNVVWERDVEMEVVRYKTFREVREGEELCEWMKRRERLGTICDGQDR